MLGFHDTINLLLYLCSEKSTIFVISTILIDMLSFTWIGNAIYAKN